MKKFLSAILLIPALALAEGGDPRLSARQSFLAAKMAQSEGQLLEAKKLYEAALALSPSDPVLHYELAVLLQELGLDDDARTHAASAAKADPEDDGAWKLLGSIDLAASEKDPSRAATAVEELERAKRLNPRDMTLLVALCRAELADGRPDRARAALEELPGIMENPALLRLKAQADDRRGADAEAAGDYEAWLSADPGNREASADAIGFFESRRNYARALQLLGHLQKSDLENFRIGDQIALDLLRSGKFAEAQRQASALAEKYPEDRSVRRTLASVLYEVGESAKAAEILRKLIQQDPDDPAPLLSLAGEYESEGKTPEARKLLTDFAKSLEAVPGHTELAREVQAEIAASHYREHEFARAVEISKAAAIAKGSVNDRALGLLLQRARDEKKPAEGLSWAEKALAEEPKNPDWKAAVAEFQIRNGQAEAGHRALQALAGSGIATEVLSAAEAEDRVKHYEESASMAGAALPRFAGNLDLQFRQAASLERAGKLEDAAKIFRSLLASRPDDAQTLNYLGYMFADNNVHLAEARTLLEKAVALDPQNGAYLDSLGWLHYRLNDPEKARAYLLRAALRMPSDPTVQEHLGDLQASLGRKAEAIVCWKKSLTLSPDEPEKIEKKIHDAGSSP